jgi:hypothetical protein
VTKGYDHRCQLNQVALNRSMISGANGLSGASVRKGDEADSIVAI